MAEFPTYEQMAKKVAEKALDEILYDGKSIREWMKIIVEQEPKTDTWSIKDVANALEKHGFGRLDQDPCEDCIRKQDEIRKAYDKGIKNGLIPKEPCEDCISRKAVLELAEWFDRNKQHFNVANLIDEVENMPSVRQKTGHWIVENWNNIAEQRWKVRDDMTKQRAISHLKDISMWGTVNADEYNALKMAIEALEQKPKIGHWIDKKPQIPGGPFSKMYWCDQCDGKAYKSDYCPNCGAKMKR